MKLQDHYDWIVLGEQPSALLTASLVARMGLSVLILPLASGMKFSVSSEGQCHDPESNVIVGLGEHGGARGLISEGLKEVLGSKSEEFSNFFEMIYPQILTPESRFFFSDDSAEIRAEVQREIGSAAGMHDALGALKKIEKEYLGFWQKLPESLGAVLGTKTLSSEGLAFKELGRYFKKNHPKNRLFNRGIGKKPRLSAYRKDLARVDYLSLGQGFWYFVGSSSLRDPDILEMMQIWSLSRVTGSFKGGITAYRQYLIDLAMSLGVHVFPELECKRIFVENGRFAGIQVSERGKMILGQGGILGCPLDRAFSNLIYTGRAWLHRKKKGPRPMGWKFTLGLTVHKEAIPIGMKKRLIWQEENAPVFEIETADPEDYSTDYHVANSDQKIVYLRTVMPMNSKSLDLDFQRLTCARMVRQAMEIMPFLEYHVTRVYPEFRVGKVAMLVQRAEETADHSQTQSGDRESGLTELQDLYGFSSLDKIPSNLLVYDPAAKGVGPYSGIDGLFVSSEESYPRYGGFGATIAAFEAVATFAQRMGLNQGSKLQAGATSSARAEAPLQKK